MLICMSTFTFIYFFRGSLDCAQALPVFTMNTSAMLKSKRHSFFRSEPPTSSVLFPCLLPSTSSFHFKGIFFRHNKALWGFTDLPRTDKAPTISFPSKGNRRRYYIKKWKINPDSSASSQAGMSSDILWQLQAEVVNAWSMLKFPGLNSMCSLDWWEMAAC